MNKPLFPNEFPMPSGNFTTVPAEARKRPLDQVVSHQASAVKGGYRVRVCAMRPRGWGFTARSNRPREGQSDVPW
ncbi:hypothetical protein JMJ77_0009130 [Colletotrichum scovillei]|uniref:Uncharacterized protein n=1 Tax=Colletotrichum scovillei TaxID=1209932 RepID=A0A9P7U7H6_9PEZI|nr:hypothetical protein JMJ77_0009130 [Colletotrichum scovillei]KAG7052205.1 hypothetical protein JMJ78_0005227 [Colletotrichum scovillei]KAG7064495.1 hypothetical protein JMJ76_0012259 [Colletotrichum scovillei]